MKDPRSIRTSLLHSAWQRRLLAWLIPEDRWSIPTETAADGRTLLAFWALAAMPWPIVFAMIYTWWVPCLPAAVTCAFSAFCFLFAPLLLRYASSPCAMGHYLAFVMTVTLAAVAAYTGGSGTPAVRWVIITPLVAIFVTGLRGGLYWTLATLLVLSAFRLAAWWGWESPHQLDPDHMKLLHHVSDFSLLLLVATLSAAYELQRRRALELARARQAKLGEALQRAELQARELAEQSAALSASEDLHSRLVRNAPFGMLFGDLHEGDSLVLRAANPAAEGILKIDPRTMMGQPLKTALPALDVGDALHQCCAAARAGTVWTADEFDYRDNRIECTLSIRAFQTAPGKMVMVFADVTQRVCVQRALGESEARFRAIFESSPSPIVICRLTDGVLLGVSPQFERWSGYSREEAVGRSMADLGLAGAAAIDGILAVLRDAGPVDQALVQGRRKDGACVEYLFSAVALEWGGTPSAIVMTADVTEQRRAESALHASKMEIARQAGRAEVATDVLHNVGNVLNSVNMSATLVGDKLRKSEVGTLGLAAQMMLDHAGDLPGFLTTDQRGKRMPALLGELAQVLTADQATLLAELGNLSAAVEHLRRIVDIQQVSGSSRSVTEWANPCEIVDRAIHLSSAWLHRHGIQIQTRCGFDQPVLLDTHKLLQVVVNLLNNAKDALKQVPLDRRQLDVSVEEADGPEGKCLRIVVIDNGAGIAPEHLARLFTFGFTTRPHGHGYGLHSAALLAKDMRGSLTAFSRGIGCGAAFTLELPLVMQESSS